MLCSFDKEYCFVFFLSYEVGIEWVLRIYPLWSPFWWFCNVLWCLTRGYSSFLSPGPVMCGEMKGNKLHEINKINNGNQTWSHGSTFSILLYPILLHPRWTALYWFPAMIDFIFIFLSLYSPVKSRNSWSQISRCSRREKRYTRPMITVHVMKILNFKT